MPFFRRRGCGYAVLKLLLLWWLFATKAVVVEAAVPFETSIAGLYFCFGTISGLVTFYTFLLSNLIAFIPFALG